MSIPSGVPTVLRIVKGGSGGPNHDSIPVREDLSGPTEGYLKNDSIVKVAATGYRKLWGGTNWVLFEHAPDYLGDNWLEETGHLFPLPVPEPEPPAPVEDITEFEIMEFRIQPGGKMFVKTRKLEVYET